MIAADTKPVRAAHPRAGVGARSSGGDRPACDQIDAWLDVPNLVILGETSGHWARLRALLRAGGVVGARIHDGRIAAICLADGVRELLTVDRDFGRFPELRVRNPLVG